MKDKICYFIINLICLTIISKNIYCQTYPFSEEGYDYPARTDGGLPPVKVLIVPVIFDPNCATHSGDACWPLNGIPVDLDKYFDATQSTNPVGYFTKYYYDASFGKLIVLGDYLTQPVIIPCGTSNGSHYYLLCN